MAEVGVCAMSLAVTCWWTLVRTVVLCLLAWPICWIIERCLRRLNDTWQHRLMCWLLAPALFPELLVGYSFRDLALANPLWAEPLCSVLLFVRIVPVGTVAILAAPRSEFGAASIHCRWLAIRSFAASASRSENIRQWIELAHCYWHGPITRALPALALMSIVAFQEFEMAALLQTISWTDWFVTAQRLGTKQGEMLTLSLWPLLLQLPIMVGVVRWLRASSSQAGQSSNIVDGIESPIGRPARVVGPICIGFLLIVGCLIPIALIGWRTCDGLLLLMRQRHQQWGLAREIITSGSVAVCAGLTAWNISGRLRFFTVNGSFVGLFGSMLLSLGCVGLFQQSWCRPFYDTPIPWVLTLIVWLMPRAAILRLWLQSMRNDEAAHVAQLMTPGQDRQRLLWRLCDQPRFLAGSLLCYWAYCDLPTAYMLAPTGMASGLVRLYNFMHFGRSAALSAEACVFFGTPVVLVALMVLLFRISKD